VRKHGPYLILLLLLAACFSLATVLQQRAPAWTKRAQSDNVLKVLFGDGRRFLADGFFRKADVSFHSGFYPTIFDQARASQDTRHLTAKEGEPAAEEHEKQFNFLGRPRDWIERFGRHFAVTSHTHLEGKNEREILPWLKMSAELDPQKIETYTVSAYWLRDLGKFKDAEELLREGLRNNPDSYEILFELGRLYSENYHDPAHARNVWELALHRWTEQEAAGKKPDLRDLDRIAVYLSHLEEEEGNLARALSLLQLARKASPNPGALQAQIDELTRKLAARSPAPPPQSR
jgi:tetratricopeptide (TPR) repeat protein